jgi:hypothetical protein
MLGLLIPETQRLAGSSNLQWGRIQGHILHVMNDEGVISTSAMTV